MARKLRIEYPGAIYHVTSRGQPRGNVFSSEDKKAAFLKCLGEAAAKSGWVVHAWSILGNQYHLCLETPRPNLVEGMQWLQATFCVGLNRSRKAEGPVFQGRYKAALVAPAALGAVCDYIHLNPIGAGATSIAAFARWKGTSLSVLLDSKTRPAWFSPSAALRHAGRLKDDAKGRKKYHHYLQELAGDEKAKADLQFDRIAKDWAIGPRDFKLALIKEHKKLLAEFSSGDANPKKIAETLWAKTIVMYLKKLQKTARDVSKDRKAAPWKVAVAAAMKSNTTASNPWLADRLNMGSPSRLSREVTAARDNPGRSETFAKALKKCKV